jgi:hypothetical protein
VFMEGVGSPTGIAMFPSALMVFSRVLERVSYHREQPSRISGGDGMIKME